MGQNNNDEIEIDLKELFYVLLSHWMKIVLSAVLCAAIALVYTKIVTVPLYSSTAQLYVLTKSTSITSLADIQSGTNLAQDYKVVITSRPVVGQVIKNLELEDTYESLGGRLTVENPQNTRILMITVADTDPERAKMIVDEFAVVASDYISDKMDQDAPSIIEEGYVSGEQINSNTARNTMLGGILGAFAACMLILLSHVMNDKITTSEDLEKYLGLNTLAAIPLDENEAKTSKRAKKTARKEVKKDIKKRLAEQTKKTNRK